MSAEPQSIRDLASAQAAIDELVAATQWQLDILSPALDPYLYSRAPVATAVQRIVVDGGRRARIRILLEDGAGLSRSGHRLIRLAQQFTSAI